MAGSSGIPPKEGGLSSKEANPPPSLPLQGAREMEARGEMVERYRRWRRRELLWYRAKITLGLGAFVALAWMTILLFGE